MSEINSKLESFDDDKLIDIVKNFKQYGYSNELRSSAVNILENRGVDEQYLKLTGNFENTQYNSSEKNYNLFLKNSKIAFFSYLSFFLIKIISPFFLINSEFILLFITIFTLIFGLVYILFLIKSFINQQDFKKEIRKEHETGGVLIYLLLGMPFYIFFYFYFKNKMKEDFISGFHTN